MCAITYQFNVPVYGRPHQCHRTVMHRRTCCFRIEKCCVKLGFTDWHIKWRPCLLNFWQEGCIWFSYCQPSWLIWEYSNSSSIWYIHLTAHQIQWGCHNYDRFSSQHSMLAAKLFNHSFSVRKLMRTFYKLTEWISRTFIKFQQKSIIDMW